MKTDNMQVVIRPMNTLQAIDLGTMVARHWFIPLWKLWIQTALPIFVLYMLIILLDGFYNKDFVISSLCALIFWWCKPLYEKPLVSWLGEALFNQDINTITLQPQSNRLRLQHSLKLLFRYRLSSSRHIILPVLMLENTDNKQQMIHRLHLLKRGQGNDVFWHTVIMMNFEMLVSIALMLFLYSLIPQSLMSTQILINFLEHSPVVVVLGSAILYFLIVSIVAPFFICSGFIVYLTKRCLLEGWDIEVVFRTLGKRFIESNKRVAN